MRYLNYIFLAGSILLVGCGDSTTDTEQVATPSATQESVAPELYSQETLTEEQITACIERGMSMEKIDDLTYRDGEGCVEMLIQGIEKFPLAAAPEPKPNPGQPHYPGKPQDPCEPPKCHTEEQIEAKLAAMAKEGQKYLSLDITTVTENLPHVRQQRGGFGAFRSEGAAVTFTDNLITNTHPDSNLVIDTTEKLFDDEGFFLSEGGGQKGCIQPNETWRYRERIHVEGMEKEAMGLKESTNRLETETVYSIVKEEDLELYLHRGHNGWANCVNEPDHYMLSNSPTKKEIDESLLDEVEVIITVPPLQPDRHGGPLILWGTYTVELKNRSANEVEWKGEYEVKDEFGYILHRTQPNGGVGPNQRQTWEVSWWNRPNMHTSTSSQIIQRLPFGHVRAHCFYVDIEGNQCSELGVEFPTLVTTHLKAR